MKRKLNKYMTKAFMDDIYQNNVYKLQFNPVPMTIFIGTNDTLIPRQDTLDFAKLHNCKVIYIDDMHCIENQESWQIIIDYLKKL